MISSPTYWLEPVSAGSIDYGVRISAEKLRELEGAPNKRKRLTDVKRELFALVEESEGAPNSDCLIDQRLSLRVLIGKVHFQHAALMANSSKSTPKDRTKTALSDLATAEASFEAALRLKPDHPKTMLRLIRVHLARTQIAPSDKAIADSLRKARAVRRELDQFSTPLAAYWSQIARAEIALRHGFLSPQKAPEMLETARLALRAASKLRPDDGFAARQEMCQNYFRQPTLPDRWPSRRHAQTTLRPTR
ncbi:MAG TPA: hypothetical protein VFR09_02755 [Alphaproteobacteria bacterium]|nr:hypothetical protein [Alphaproteobacteria bacterium]